MNEQGRAALGSVRQRDALGSTGYRNCRDYRDRPGESCRNDQVQETADQALQVQQNSNDRSCWKNAGSPLSVLGFRPLFAESQNQSEWIGWDIVCERSHSTDLRSLNMYIVVANQGDDPIERLKLETSCTDIYAPAPTKRDDMLSQVIPWALRQAADERLFEPPHKIMPGERVRIPIVAGLVKQILDNGIKT